MADANSKPHNPWIGMQSCCAIGSLDRFPSHCLPQVSYNRDKVWLRKPLLPVSCFVLFAMLRRGVESYVRPCPHSIIMLEGTSSVKLHCKQTAPSCDEDWCACSSKCPNCSSEFSASGRRDSGQSGEGSCQTARLSFLHCCFC